LRTNLLTLDRDTPLRTLMVTSAEPGEGKSTIVANLAFALAQSGRKVIVVDTDLRLPTLHKIFDLPSRIGLSSILQRKITVDEGLRNSDIPGLQVLTSGPFPSDPAEWLGLPRMRTVVERLIQLSDVVLLDTPALLPVTDAAILAPLVDGVI